MMPVSWDTFLQKIKQRERIILEKANQIQELVIDRKKKEDYAIQCYFTYSIHIARELEEDNLLIGSLHVVNNGDKPLTNPYICLHFPPDSLFQFSGKYKHKDTKISIKSPDMWERINEKDNKEQFWLRPMYETIQPKSSITFTNFQLKWTSKEKYTSSLKGFAYCEEVKDGVPALNQIYISG